LGQRLVAETIIDQGGCFETSRPTTHGDPTFVVDDILRYCVANMPGAVPATSTHALANATLPYLQRLAAGGTELLLSDPGLREGVNIAGGHVTNLAVAQAQNLDCVSVTDALKPRVTP
jgi:alanine dehydrogenase